MITVRWRIWGWCLRMMTQWLDTGGASLSQVQDKLYQEEAMWSFKATKSYSRYI
jgi:hypothetical protein